MRIIKDKKQGFNHLRAPFGSPDHSLRKGRFGLWDFSALADWRIDVSPVKATGIKPFTSATTTLKSREDTT